MAFSRLQLAAVLLEYDNDLPGTTPRKASESAIFAHTRPQRRPTPTDQRQSSRPPTTHPRRKSLLSYELNEDGTESLRDSYQPRGQVPDSHPDRRASTFTNSTSLLSPRAASPEPEPEEAYGPHGEVDLASWGLPEEFIAQEAMRSPRIPQSTVRDASPARQAKLSSSSTSRPKSVHALELLNASHSQHGQRGFQPLSPTIDTIISTLPTSSPSPPKRGRRGHQGRTVSFGDYDSIVSASERERITNGVGRVEEEDDMPKAEEIVRPNSVMGVLNRGRPSLDGSRPVSPFNPLSTIARADARGADEEIEVLGNEGDTNSDMGTGRRPGSILDRGRPKSPFETLPRHSMSSTTSNPAAIPFPQDARAPSPGPSIQRKSNPWFVNDRPDDTPGGTNPFAVPPPPGDRMSRFDPKGADAARRMSFSSQLDGPSYPARPSSRSSGYFVDQPPAQTYEEDQERRRYSRAILRPKTLVMPSPLQSVLDPNQSAPPSEGEKRGFLAGAKPLPPGALTRPDSFLGSLPSSHSLPSIGMALTASQNVFRSSLMVGGQRGEGFIGGAEEDGKIGLQNVGGRVEEEGEDWRPVIRSVEGESLMDRLEARKAELRKKQRVFTGDARPSMMTRGLSAGSHLSMSPPQPGTSPIELLRIPSQSSPQRPGQPRRMSSGPKPLLSFESENNYLSSPPRPGMADRATRGRSVFGVDTIWEKEMEKLKLAEEAERVAEEERRRKEQEKARKRKLKGKGKERVVSGMTENEWDLLPEVTPPAPQSPPRAELPYILPSPNKSPSAPKQDARRKVTATAPMGVQDWVESSEDEDADPDVRRRKVSRAKAQAKLVQKQKPKQEDEGSDSDVPLAAVFRGKQRKADSSSEEDEPLSKLVANRQASHATLRGVPAKNIEEDDDVPLGLKHPHRQSQMPPQNAEDDDEVPLGMRHSMAANAQAQRQSMAFMAMQQQQQQQQMYQQSVYGGMPVMGMGMGMPPMMGMGQPAMGMMQPSYFGFNPSMTSLQRPGRPQQDPSIDRWRREVEAREASIASGRSSGQRD